MIDFDRIARISRALVICSVPFVGVICAAKIIHVIVQLVDKVGSH